MESILKRKTKQVKEPNVKKEKDLRKMKKMDSSFKRILFLFILLIVLIGLFFYMRYVDGKRVSVVQLKNPVIAGDVINPATDFQKYDMLYATYKEQGTVTYTDENGNKKRKNIYVPWEYRDQLKEWFYNNYLDKDTILTTQSISKEMEYKNPLIENMPEGNEEYVLPINADSINLHQLYPGTILRMRVAFEVPITVEEECRRALAAKTEYDGTSTVLKILREKGYDATSTGAAGDDIDESFQQPTSQPTDARTTTVSEVIFDTISSVDMLSTGNESIYEVYMALLKKPLEQRVPYLQTSFDNDQSGDFRERITPKSLVLSLTKSEASSMYEFEEMGYSIKWTIVKTATSSDMLKDFVTINEQIKAAGGM